MPADGTLFGDLKRSVIVDLFCGTGGSSCGTVLALGRGPDVAVNHWDYAIKMHARNHPETVHYQEDVFNIEPWKVCRGKRVKLLIGTAPCTHYSAAKGSAPKDEKIRCLSNVFIKWAEEIRPDVILLENVREFAHWGPLYPDDYPIEDLRGQPIPERKGEDFQRWLGQLKAAGYTVEYRLLKACDYGAPTSRTRLFLIARCDGKPITWPTPTHGGTGQPPYKSAASCIDWSVPMCSIFATPKEAKQWAREHGTGIPVRPLADKTMTRIAAGIDKYVLKNPKPFLLQMSHGGRLEPIDDPLRTITTTKGGERALVAPVLSRQFGESVGQNVLFPMPTTMAERNKTALVSAFLAKNYTGVIGADVQAPLSTITTQDHHSLVAANLIKFYGTSTGAPLDAPHPVVTSSGLHSGLVYAFMQKYYGASGQNQSIGNPLDVVTTKARFGVVCVDVGGEPWGIVDIRMRMLKARELATAQGFSQDYILEGSEADQIRGIGNSVAPQVVAALVAAVW